MKARICEDLFSMLTTDYPDEYDDSSRAALLELSDRISGQIVELRFVGDDAFEVIDDNFLLPPRTWQPVDEATP